MLSPQNSTLTIEEFHAKLQEATNFPLRPFVIPFLKVSAPCVPSVGLSAVTREVGTACKPFAIPLKIPFLDVFFHYFFFPLRRDSPTAAVPGSRSGPVSWEMLNPCPFPACAPFAAP